MSLYLRELESRGGDRIGTVSSRTLADALGLTDAQVRKDIAVLGQTGQPGIGYRAGELVRNLRRLLGTDRRWPVAVVGAGNIGRALVSYPRLGGKGFEVAVVLDADPEVVGTTISDREVRPAAELASAIRDAGVRMAFLAVPGEAAQAVAERLVAAGIVGILNFAPVRLDLPPEISVVNVDLTVAIEQLAHRVAMGLGGDEGHEDVG